MTGDLDTSRALESAAARMEQRRVQREEVELDGAQAQVIVLLMFGRIETKQQSKLEEAVHRCVWYGDILDRIWKPLFNGDLFCCFQTEQVLSPHPTVDRLPLGSMASLRRSG